ncbi:hypothetical protein H4Q26_004301 [Puccinia striiformis f. sp. tritici PST-130]|nr:hypothetical protein H4Q26_004301 [Puccinia striiformis f. sp. tritici PST-130]
MGGDVVLDVMGWAGLRTFANKKPKLDIDIVVDILHELESTADRHERHSNSKKFIDPRTISVIDFGSILMTTISTAQFVHVTSTSGSSGVCHGRKPIPSRCQPIDENAISIKLENCGRGLHPTLDA